MYFKQVAILACKVNCNLYALIYVANKNKRDSMCRALNNDLLLILARVYLYSIIITMFVDCNVI